MIRLTIVALCMRTCQRRNRTQICVCWRFSDGMYWETGTAFSHYAQAELYYGPRTRPTRIKNYALITCQSAGVENILLCSKTIKWNLLPPKGSTVILPHLIHVRALLSTQPAVSLAVALICMDVRMHVPVCMWRPIHVLGYIQITTRDHLHVWVRSFFFFFFKELSVIKTNKNQGHCLIVETIDTTCITFELDNSPRKH